MAGSSIAQRQANSQFFYVRKLLSNPPNLRDLLRDHFFKKRGPWINAYFYFSYTFRNPRRALLLVYFCHREMIHSTISALGEAGNPDIEKCRHVWPLLTLNICSQKFTNEVLRRKPINSLLLGTSKMISWL